MHAVFSLSIADVKETIDTKELAGRIASFGDTIRVEDDHVSRFEKTKTSIQKKGCTREGPTRPPLSRRERTGP